MTGEQYPTYLTRVNLQRLSAKAKVVWCGCVFFARLRSNEFTPELRLARCWLWAKQLTSHHSICVCDWVESETHWRRFYIGRRVVIRDNYSFVKTHLHGSHLFSAYASPVMCSELMLAMFAHANPGLAQQIALVKRVAIQLFVFLIFIDFFCSLLAAANEAHKYTLNPM